MLVLQGPLRNASLVDKRAAFPPFSPSSGFPVKKNHGRDTVRDSDSKRIVRSCLESSTAKKGKSFFPSVITKLFRASLLESA